MGYTNARNCMILCKYITTHCQEFVTPVMQGCLSHFSFILVKNYFKRGSGLCILLTLLPPKRILIKIINISF